MSTAIAILGGVGLFLLGMTIMTDGLKALAGSALRTVLGKAAATPVSGALWGAIVTLLVQSSSAVTMTTIGLVSAGLLTFPQGLGLVFGANVGARVGNNLRLSLFCKNCTNEISPTAIGVDSGDANARNARGQASPKLSYTQQFGLDSVRTIGLNLRFDF